MMTVLLLLSNADSNCLIEAIKAGGIGLLDKLYKHNKEECENAIIQMVKQNISMQLSKFDSYTSPSTYYESSSPDSRSPSRVSLRHLHCFLFSPDGDL